MRVLITGGRSGQLHHELLSTTPDDVTLVQPEVRLDITDRDDVRRVVQTLKPQIIINAAAYTAVDKAESEVEQARAVNATAVGHLAEAAAEQGAHVLHVSTDFVFGKGDGSPYRVDSDVAPVSVYGQTKLEGEQRLASVLPTDSATFRTAWVYSTHGNNFVKTMLRLMSERDELGVIADQVGSPTWARSLAEALWLAARQRTTGMHHWTGAGVASWYDFAVAIRDEAVEQGLLCKEPRIKPLRTDQYPTPAARPPYSVLELTRTWEALGTSAEHWRHDLRLMLGELK